MSAKSLWCATWPIRYVLMSREERLKSEWALRCVLSINSLYNLRQCRPELSLQKCCFVGTTLQPSISAVPMGLCWRTYTNTDGLLCHPDLKALLHHVYWLCCHCWQENGSLEAAEGFATSSVTLAHLQPRDSYTSRDKARLFLLTHLYSVHCHTVRSYAGDSLACLN